MTEYEVSYDGSIPVRVVATTRKEAIDEFMDVAAEINQVGERDRSLCEVTEV